MATRARDVAESVHEVVAAFDQAINYVRRLEDRKDGKEDPEAIHDLYKSLALGPTIVQGYFDADSKRLGPSYLIGDPAAQFQLRDVLFSLRTLVSDLQSALLDDKELNYKELQDTSDTCRVNAGVCLGQLSQRLTEVSDHLKVPLQTPPAYMSTFSSPSLDYSSSRSTHSSGRERMPRTPDPFYTQHNLTPYWQIKRAESNEQYDLGHKRQDTETSIQDSYTDWLDTSNQLFVERDPEQLSMRRPSSHTLAPEDGALLSPRLPPESPLPLLPGQLDITRDSYTSFTTSRETLSPGRGFMTSAQPENKQTRERFDPDDFSPVAPQTIGLFFPEQSDDRQSITSYASRAYDSTQHSGLEIVSSGVSQQSTNQPFRLPHRPLRNDSQDSQGRPVRKPVAQYPGTPPTAFNDQFNTGYQTSYSAEPQQQSPQLSYLQPRTQSRPSPSVTAQRTINPPSAGPPYQPSAAVQIAMAKARARQHSTDNTPRYNTAQNVAQSSPQQPPSNYAATTSRSSPYVGASTSMQSLYSIFPQPPQTQSPLQMPSVPLQYRPSQQQFRQQQPPQQQQQQQQQLQIEQLRQQQRQQQQLLPQTPPVPQTPPIPQPFQPAQTPPQPSPQPQQQLQPSPNLQKSTSVSAPPIPQNIPLNLPTDKNTLPFCKGAFRLLTGLNKKAFIDAVRPIGMTSTVSYWRCDKCFFEGPMYHKPGPPDKKGRPGKPEKIFDPTVRECGPLSTAVVGTDGRGEGSGGIRYTWSFLAKCHVPQKSIPMGKHEDTFGGYGCIFCAAEGQARGWTGPNGALTSAQGFGSTSDTASTFSGRSGHTTASGSGGTSSSTATPIFGNLRTFMDHLQLHRRPEAWPCAEMQGRMKCIVGRKADRWEDFEINLLPLEN